MQNIFIASCIAQDATIAKVDDFIKSEMQKQRIPGVSLAVVKEGKVVLEKGYGFLILSIKLPLSPKQFFNRVR